MNETQFTNLRKEVERFQNQMNECEKRVSVCCSVTKDKITIKRDWTNRMLNGDGTCVTSLEKESPVDNIISRIATGMGI